MHDHQSSATSTCARQNTTSNVSFSSTCTDMTTLNVEFSCISGDILLCFVWSDAVRGQHRGVETCDVTRVSTPVLTVQTAVRVVAFLTVVLLSSYNLMTDASLSCPTPSSHWTKLHEGRLHDWSTHKAVIPMEADIENRAFVCQN